MCTFAPERVKTCEQTQTLYDTLWVTVRAHFVVCICISLTPTYSFHGKIAECLRMLIFSAAGR